jgi:very-short-patch-repair endonuclease
LLALHIRGAKLPAPEREHRFHPTRRWRFDFAWPEHMLAAEVEGLNPRGKSRHTTVTGYRADCEKYNAAALLGWRVLRFEQRLIESGEAIASIEQALERAAA